MAPPCQLLLAPKWRRHSNSMSNRLVRIGSALSRSVVGLSRSDEVCRAVELLSLTPSLTSRHMQSGHLNSGLDSGSSEPRQLDSSTARAQVVLVYSRRSVSVYHAVYTLEARRDVFLKPQRSVRSRQVLGSRNAGASEPCEVRAALIGRCTAGPGC